ncbi:MAG: universal stress protein [Rubricoccaceae bacterium]
MRVQALHVRTYGISMTAPRTLVVALDFSPGSRAALRCAADLATRSGATLHLLHADVLFRSSGDGAPPDGVPSSTLRVRIERFATDELGSLTGRDTKIAVVRDVNPSSAILRYAAEVDADLLVMGTHGRSGLSRLLMGSVAGTCVASAPCPVLTVPFETSALDSAAPILVAIDFSERSGVALKAGHALAALYGSEVELVHVVRDSGPYPGFAPNILSLVDYDPAQGEAVQERMKRFVERMDGPDPSAYHVAIGSPSRVIPALASEQGAGAIVMGTHGRQGVAHALIGSVAEATLRRSTCPVLTLKEIHRQKADVPSVGSAIPS